MINCLVAGAAYPKLESMSILLMYYTNQYVSLKPDPHTANSFQDECLFTGVPDNAADLVTMMQGLHHLPQDLLPTFLSEVLRVLKPGGIFIVREHDCSDELLPMLDLAHSVFNVLTGVSAKEEASEIRAFRPVNDWLQIIEANGLCNTQLYEIQADDPTVDVMMCFYKAPWSFERNQSRNQLSQRSAESSSSQPPSETISSVSSNTTAEAALSVAHAGVTWLLKFINDFEISALSMWPQQKYPAQFAVAQGLVKPAASAARAMMQRLDSLLAAASANAAKPSSIKSSPSPGTDFFPPEMFVAYETLAIRVKTGIAASPEIILYSIISSIIAAFLGDTTDPAESSAEVSGQDSAIDGASNTTTISASEARQVILILQSSHPDIMTPMFWRRCGFPKQVQSIVASMGGNIDAASQRLSSVLDRTSFDELYSASRDVQSFSQPLNMDIMLGKQHPGNPWWRCVCAILGSPSIRITQAMRWAASALGFNEWITLCETSQALRRHSAVGSTSGANKEISKLVAETRGAFLKPQDITMETKGQTPFPPIHNVAEIVHARCFQHLRF